MMAEALRDSIRADGSDGELTHRQIVTILLSLVTGMFLAALDQTIVSTSIKTIGDDLDELSAQAWVTTAFLITSTIATPLFGKLSDILGRKRLFMFAISLFAVGSTVCGVATSMYELAAFRAIQGVGAGGIIPLASAVIGDIIPPRERARYQGYLIVVFAGSLGPVLGGAFSGADEILGVAGWRWIFYVNVPVAALALVSVGKVLSDDAVGRQRQPVDWWGSVLLGVGLVPFLIVAEQGHVWGWGSIRSVGCVVLGVGGLAAFVWGQRRMGDDALLPLRLFRVRAFAVASAHVTIVDMAMFAVMAILPLYLQVVRGADPTRAGLLMLPLVVGMMSASLLSGRVIACTGRYRVLPITGSVFMFLGACLMATLSADTPLWGVDLMMVCFGIGVGLNLQSLLVATQNVVSAKDMGVATASSLFFRTVGGAVGTAVFLSVLFTQAREKISDRYARAVHQRSFAVAVRDHAGDMAEIQRHVANGLNDSSFLGSLPPALSRPFLAGFSSAVDVAFLVASALLVLAIGLSTQLREVPLRAVSGARARAMAKPTGPPTVLEAGWPSTARDVQ